MKQQLAEIDQIANNKAAPTFENTIVALEKSGRMLDRVSQAFFGVVQANTNDTLDKTQAAVAPKLAAHQDAITLNPKLFARVKAVYDSRAKLKLDPESLQLLTIDYLQFIHAGANLSEAGKKRLMEINKEDASLRDRVPAEADRGFESGCVRHRQQGRPRGLERRGDRRRRQGRRRPQDARRSTSSRSRTRRSSPVLASLTDRAVREKIFGNSWTRTEKSDASDTRATISELAKIRAEKAKLLGYPNYAAYVLYDQMAKTPEAVEKFIAQLVPATAAKAADEGKQIQAMIDKSGKHFDLKPWDWEMYSEKVRKAKYDLDQNELKPYFELNKVLQDGVFYAAGQLYGITFKERHDIPVYQPDVRVFDVFDKDGSQLA